jgi:hypothetical protein
MSQPNPGQDWWPWRPMWLAIEDLRAENFEPGHRGTGFQRKLSNPFIVRIANEFEGGQVDPVHVVRVDDQDGTWYSIVDGQHTVAVLKRRGKDQVPCLAHVNALGYAERAHLFTRFNSDKRKLTAREFFAGLFEEGDDTALAILELVEGAGFYLDCFRVGDNGLKRLTYGGHIMLEFKRDANALAGALSALRTWKQHSPIIHEAKIIRALCELARKPEFRPDHMAHRLEKKLPTAIAERALQLDRGTRSPTVMGFTHAFAELHNQRMRKDFQVKLDDDD